MKQTIFSRILILFVVILLMIGCQRQATVKESATKPKEGQSVAAVISDIVGVYSAYAPAKLEILPLTEFAGQGGSQPPSRLSVYVSLLDSFGCKTKSPGIFRIELYEFVQRSSEPKGQRLAFLPDVDLTDPARNNSCWRDFLRAYELNLDFQPQTGKTYMLAATFLCPGGKRLSAEFTLKTQK
jgi:hypothetical protein